MIGIRSEQATLAFTQQPNLTALSLTRCAATLGGTRIMCVCWVSFQGPLMLTDFCISPLSTFLNKKRHIHRRLLCEMPHGSVCARSPDTCPQEQHTEPLRRSSYKMCEIRFACAANKNSRGNTKPDSGSATGQRHHTLGNCTLIIWSHTVRTNEVVG